MTVKIGIPKHRYNMNWKKAQKFDDFVNILYIFLPFTKED